MLAPPRINGLATAAPATKVPQPDAKAYFTELFRKGLADVDRLSSVFDNGRVDNRYIAESLEWMGSQHSFEEKNRLVIDHSVEVAAEAAEKAFADAGIHAKDIEALVVVSSSSVATPSLDALLIERLGLSRHTVRQPMFGLGCAGGVAGISHAADLARSMPGRNVLFIAVEMNTLTFQCNDMSKTNFISSSLFGDGAAAVVLNTWGDGPKFIGRHNTLLPKSEWVMGWEVIETGLKVRISTDIPSVVDIQLPQLFEDACDRWGVSRQQIRHFILHPGGARVLDAYVNTLDLSEENLKHSSDVLREFGNMSSPTVLFVLDRFLREPPEAGEYGILLGFGPGFSADQALLQW